jgi:signal transduction histidine kinase
MPNRFRRLSVYVLGVLAVCLAGVVVRDAVGWYGRPIGGLWFDRDGVVSNFGLPSWDGSRQGLRFPDRVLEVDGQNLTDSRSGSASRVWNRAVVVAHEAGQRTVHARVLTNSTVRDVDLAIEPLGPLAWWSFAGGLFFAGAVYVGAALIAMWVSPKAPLALAFAKFAVFAGVLVSTLFDLHTTQRLVPIFHMSFAMIPSATLGLALRLPDDAPLLKRMPWIVGLADAGGLSLTAAFWIARLLGMRTTSLQTLATFLCGAALLLFVVTLAIRFLVASGARRGALRSLLLAMAIPAGILAGCSVFMFTRSLVSVGFVVASPLYVLAPLGMVIAFVRHDIWSTRALLSRMLTRAIIAVGVCIFSIGFGAVIATSLGVPFSHALGASAAGAIVAAVLVMVALHFGDRTFFPSLAEYKPTVEQLSEELTSIASPDAVARAIERTVRRWLPCDVIELAVAPVPEWKPPSSRPPAAGGKGIFSSRPPPASSRRGPQTRKSDQPDDEITLPVAFEGVALGHLRVGQKRGGALFTSEDMDLLKTVANQGALALAHAIAYAELDRRRKQQAAAWRDEREALVETLSAEIAHEVRYPINFFRSIFVRASANRMLDAEDIEIGCEEVDRLERLVSGLKRMASQHLEPRTVGVAELCARAEALLRDRLGDRRLVFEIVDTVSVRCDVDKVTQILVNLLANALDAAGDEGTVGVTWRTVDRGGALVVWDNGPGFEGDMSRIFAPWYTTKPKGTGLGLTITHRLVRAHGWEIDPRRTEDTTMFVVGIPLSDIVESSKIMVAGDSNIAADTYNQMSGGDQIA